MNALKNSIRKSLIPIRILAWTAIILLIAGATVLWIKAERKSMRRIAYSQIMVNSTRLIPEPFAIEEHIGWQWILSSTAHPPGLYVFHSTNVTVTSFRSIDDREGALLDPTGTIKRWEVVAAYARKDGMRITQSFRLRATSSLPPIFVGVGHIAFDQMAYDAIHKTDERLKLAAQ